MIYWEHDFDVPNITKIYMSLKLVCVCDNSVFQISHTTSSHKFGVF